MKLTALILAAVLVPLSAAAADKAPSPRVTENPVLRVEVSGQGKPMVLIPGLTCNGDVWREAVAHFQTRYECHVVTLGGFGGKPRFEGPFLDSARDSLLAYIRAQKLKAPVIVGHSLGGTLAMELGIAAPDAIGPIVIVDALTFIGAAGDTSATEESARAQMAPMRDMIRNQTKEAYVAYQKQAPYLRSMVAPGPNYERVLQWAVTSDPKTVGDAMYDIGTRDLRAKVAAVRSPMLVLGSWYAYKDFSTRDAVEATFRRQYAKAPNWKLALADTARHFIMLDSPDWMYARMDAFLAGGETAARRGDR